MPYLRGETRKPDHCIFCHKITADDDQELVVHRSQYVYVTLNLYPYNNGHLLIVPYRHIADLTELTSDELTDLMRTTQAALMALRAVYNPTAFNIGMNLGEAAGAGVAEHLHQHVVPRWPADNNYMSVIAGTRVVPDMLEDTYRQLKEVWPASDPEHQEEENS
ncbi:MAG: HIT domain-containing protein [Anaerolineae bacterium]